MIALLEAAIAHHQAGRLDQAEGLYRHVLSLDAGQADALHLLGVLLHQRGRHEQAVEQIEAAVRLNPGEAVYHANLAEVFRAAGDLVRAAAAGRAAVRLDPSNAEARHNLALALQQQGGTDEAVAQLESAIQLRPHWPAPYLSLGRLLRDAGRPYQAVAAYREGVRLCGEAPLLHHNLGELLLEMGQPEEALPHCREAVRLRPEQPLAQAALGNVLASLGQRDQAREHLQRALQLDPRLALPYDLLGQLCQAEGKLDEAVSWYRQAIQLAPSQARFHCDLGGVLLEQERPEEALASFRQAVAAQPRSHEAHNFLGYALQDQGQMQAALAAYRAAVTLEPGYADAWLNMGILLSEMGEMQQAEDAYRQALRHEPHHPEALAGLALALRERFPADLLARGERLLAQGRVPGQRKAVLHYGLAQALDARDLPAQAAGHARQANAFLLEQARQRGQGYDPQEHRRYVDQIIRAYPAAHFERVRGWGLESEVPVFVLGLPRSGTSLVEQVLASHPLVFGAGELTLIRRAYRSIPGRVGKRAPGVECVGDLDRDLVRALAGEYLGAVQVLAPTALRVVDKMPDNYLMLGLIATLFPRARVIHTRRDVRDVGLSCWMTHFKHIRWAFDLEHIGTRIREYQRLMGHWREVLPLPMLEIDYEEVVTDLEGAARQLVAWCGLEWDPACLDFHRTRRVVRTASMTQVREPVYRRSVQRWRRYEAVLGPLLSVLGGQADAGNKPH